MQVEDYGELKPVFVDPPIEALTPYQTEQIALTLMQGNRRLIYDYLTGGSCDCSYSLGDEARFRVNIFRQQGHFSIVLRKLEGEIPTIAEPGFAHRSLQRSRRKKPGWSWSPARPAAARRRRWPRCSTRSTRRSRSTSSPWKIRLNSCIRRARPPSTSANSDTISTTIRTACAPRCARRRKSFSSAKCAIARRWKSRSWRRKPATSCLSTLHTVDAGQSINRILGLFSLGEEQQLRIRLADTLRYIVSQRLAPKVGGGRQLLTEILGHNLRTRETIALGEGEHRSFYEIIEASSPFGWMTFDQSILNAYESDLITEETARLFASRKGKVTRGIDLIQKARGVDNDLDSGLRLDLPANAFR